MPASDLKSDIKSNASDLELLLAHTQESGEATLRSPGELALANYLKNTMWPFMEGMVNELAAHEAALEEAGAVIEELEEVVDDLTESRGTVLEKDDAAIFALVVTLSRAMVAKLEKGGTPTADELNGIKMACDAAEKVIEENVINVDVDGDDEEDDDDDDE